MSTQPIELAVVVPYIAASRPAYLMCPPKLYDVNYVINPWMAGNVHASSRTRAGSLNGGPRTARASRDR